jgi:methylenetetrahydrofolate--tRNA-(uracil-5-)-methyltransferase
MLGALCQYITHANPADFQPMKANFGILPPLEGEKIPSKRDRALAYAQRASRHLDEYLRDHHV